MTTMDRAQYAALAKSRGNKFRAKSTVVDGRRFDSKAEATRYCDLSMLQRAGEIAELECQPSFQFEFDGKPLVYAGSGRRITYVADFAYVERGKRVVEDVKSEATNTPAYKIKRALMAAQYPDIEFREVMK